MIQDVVLYIVKQLVENPNQVGVTFKQEEDKTVVAIAVDASDRGKVIGKDGQTIKAIRTLIASLMPNDNKVTVDLA